MGKHKEWRKLAKKYARKRKRSAAARERDVKLEQEEKRLAESPSYQRWLEEQRRLDEFRAEENERIRLEQHRRWLEEEKVASERWLERQRKLERLKAEKAKQEMLIREEWEREQKKLDTEARKKEEERQRKERERTELVDRVEKYVLGETDNLPSSARTVFETQPGCEPCPFFSKVAACRFRDDCSRNHAKPSVSRTLLIPNLYAHFRMEHVNRCNEYDTDVGLEYDDREIYDHFVEFYDDVLNELKKFGAVVQFRVCCNEEAHLRGNVYVQYASERSAIKAFRALQGRYYGGKRVSVEFCDIPSWSRALCGLFARRKCPKGGKCNFLHAFPNPNSEFDRVNWATVAVTGSPTRDTGDECNWSWSPSPTRDAKYDRERNASKRKHRKRSRHSSRRSSKSSSKRSTRKRRSSSPENGRGRRKN